MQTIVLQNSYMKQKFANLCFVGAENVMHGLSLVVSAMRPGERAIFTIPPKLAITKSGSPASIPSSIPPEQTLRFEIELISLFAITDILENGSILKKIIKRPLPDKSPSNHADTVIGKFVTYQFFLS